MTTFSLRSAAIGIAAVVSFAAPGFAAEPDGPAELVTRSEAIRISVQDQVGAVPMKDTAEQIALAEYYSVPDRKLLWVGENGLSARGKAVVQEIAKADDYGLRASDYKLPNLAGFDASGPDAVTKLADAELKISAAVIEYARDARGGRINPQSLSKNLDPSLYLPDPAEVIGFIAIRSDPAAYLRSFQPTHPQFEALRKQLIAERKGDTAPAPVADKPEDVEIPAGPTLKLGVKHGQVALLRKRLETPAKEGADEYVFDEDLRDAVIAFQRTQGGKPDGMVGSGTRRMLNGGETSSTTVVSGQQKIDLLLVNMERYRWLPHDLGAFYVDVNIPEFKVRVFKEDEPIHETRVIVGKTHTQTPIFTDEMEEIVFRPNWYVPNSIKQNEIAPYLRRGGGFFSSGWDTSVLRRQGLRIRGANGRDIDPDRIDWSRNDIRRYELYQPPGPRNVLGLVKFRFPNTHDVYLHDTTQKNLFSNPVRAYSHGCVRVQNPDKLATVLLGHDQDWSAARVSSAMHNGADANKVFIKNRIPVYLTYFTAVADENGELKQYKDLYGHDRRMIAALNGRPIPAGLPDNVTASSGGGERRVSRRSRRGDNPFAGIFDF
ncbi:murein L,D-transpeptidase [Methyloceanibacter sp. wino2]|uniref:L,D-transpeptidase family protein n=1 Tax=Methyloceanibacter sp. wino2 TaxID=2170729 RepID=UPI00131F033C|nr:L,D-transpeptidase family protein [Methyloceanibacter sp. wino2]